MKKQKRIAAIHDISCFGKCSLTVALPVISASGIECAIIPTAVLSTHTGGFEGYTFRDLTNDILPIAKHWQTLDIDFAGIYTGFLGSAEQIDIVCETIDLLKNNDTLIAVDPVMGDNGKLYGLFDTQFPSGMKKVCELADIIIPNITEATLLLGEEYAEGPYTKDYIEQLLKRLSDIGPSRVVLTGVYFNEKELGAASYDRETGIIEYALSDRIEGYYHGTGDVFASALVSALVSGVTLSEAIRIAVDFTVGSIARTREAKTDVRFGVNFEAGLAELALEIKAASEGK